MSYLRKRAVFRLCSADDALINITTEELESMTPDQISTFLSIRRDELKKSIDRTFNKTLDSLLKRKEYLEKKRGSTK